MAEHRELCLDSINVCREDPKSLANHRAMLEEEEQ